MKIDIQFGTVFSNLFGQKSVRIEIGENTATVEKVISGLFEKYPEFYNKLKKQKLLYTDRVNAIYIVSGNLVQKDFIINGDASIRILPAIAGG